KRPSSNRTAAAASSRGIQRPAGRRSGAGAAMVRPAVGIKVIADIVGGSPSESRLVSSSASSRSRRSRAKSADGLTGRSIRGSRWSMGSRSVMADLREGPFEAGAAAGEERFDGVDGLAEGARHFGDRPAVEIAEGHHRLLAGGEAAQRF